MSNYPSSTVVEIKPTKKSCAPERKKVASKLILYSSVLLTNPGATRTFCGAAKVLLMLSATQPKGELI